MYSVEYHRISAPTPVMMSIIITDSGSTRMARSMRSPSMLTHCHSDCTAWRCDGVRLNRSKDTITVRTKPVATVATPTTRLSARSGSPGQSDSNSAPPSGRTITIQANVVISIVWSLQRARSRGSSLQTRERVHIKCQALSVHGHDQPEPDHYFGSGHDHHDERKDLPVTHVPIAGEPDQGDIG